MIPDEDLIIFHNHRRSYLGRRLYYHEKILKYKKINNILEWAITLFSSGVLVGLKLWEFIGLSSYKDLLTAIFAAIVATLGYIKLFIKPAEKIEKYRKLHEKYNNFIGDLQLMSFRIMSDSTLTYKEYVFSLVDINRKQREIAEEEDLKIETLLTVEQKQQINSELPEDNWKITFKQESELINQQNL